MVGRTMGLEPTTFGATIRRSNQLSYVRHVVALLQPLMTLCYSSSPAFANSSSPQLIRSLQAT